MLPIAIKWDEWDEKKNEFVQHNGGTMRLEHSLISISKWESLTHKPFFDNGDPSKKKTEKEMLMYVQCMCIDQPPDLSVIAHLTTEQFNEIKAYIDDKHTATWFNENNTQAKGSAAKKALTSEVIYWEMIQFNIPFSCEKWHVERLLTLIRVCQDKSGPQKKMPRSKQYAQQAKLNAMRKARLGTTG